MVVCITLYENQYERDVAAVCFKTKCNAALNRFAITRYIIIKQVCILKTAVLQLKKVN